MLHKALLTVKSDSIDRTKFWVVELQVGSDFVGGQRRNLLSLKKLLSLLDLCTQKLIWIRIGALGMKIRYLLTGDTLQMGVGSTQGLMSLGIIYSILKLLRPCQVMGQCQ